MITVGSITREEAEINFPFLASKYKGRRKSIKEFTHLSPDFVFWIHPDGQLFDARDAHKKYQPKGFEHILNDEPDYCGFLRGRVASNYGPQLIVVYCRPETLENNLSKMNQFLVGISNLPIPLDHKTLIVSDNADIYGTLNDIRERFQSAS